MQEIGDQGEQLDIPLPDCRKHLAVHGHERLALLGVFGKPDDPGQFDRFIKMKALAARLVHFQFKHQVCHVFPIRGIFLPVSDYLQIVIISGF